MTSAGIEKISFHSSLVCRMAFTEQYGAPSGLPDRATVKWRRNPTPSKENWNCTRAMILRIPTDFLRGSGFSSDKEIRIVAPAPSGKSRQFDFVFSRYAPQEIAENPAGYELVAGTILPNGETFAILSSVVDFQPVEFYVPASAHQSSDFVFPARKSTETFNQFKSITVINLHSTPLDGDAIHMLELGGYKVPAGEGRNLVSSGAVLDRTRVINVHRFGDS